MARKRAAATTPRTAAEMARPLTHAERLELIEWRHTRLRLLRFARTQPDAAYALCRRVLSAGGLRVRSSKKTGDERYVSILAPDHVTTYSAYASTLAEACIAALDRYHHTRLNWR